MLRGALALLGSVALLAGCGGGGGTRACTSPERARALQRLDADLAAIGRAAALPVHDALKGGPAVNRATDRFLLDVATAPIDNLQRNRLIDHAAAALAGSCAQCFQALEAQRPLVSIAHGDLGCPAAAESVVKRARNARAPFVGIP